MSEPTHRPPQSGERFTGHGPEWRPANLSAGEEANADVMIGHDTGCITTLDKNQWIGRAAGKPYDLPVLADCQFAALVCGAHPYKIVQTHWHASPIERLMEKLGIDWEAKNIEFEAYLEQIKSAAADQLYDPRLRITSGPGFKPVRREVIPPPPGE